ncbi:DNA polymerase zeta catalytic subunit isoform X2 [Leguminivora glycinivorella]|uniref:DNA polymerase zeta catalytic subunit isoform X2 n=1 Tax=Leguminivora glycinivorella TaxID=1035111 RepID=UPI00200DDC98|nr:DNA polymerase zeta catalytic subunit isoform X2 [Leguminivora glycinivorella]
MNSTNSFCQTKPEFSVRIVVCDHYLTKPIPGIDVIYSDFRGSDIKQVPVLRIFGPTPDGRKACVHVHGVFPYFYIPCPTPNPEPQFLYQIAASLDKALNIALKQASSANQHVYKISLVKGLPFYGFHDKDHLFLKVFLYNPGLIKQAVELCGNGAILGQTFQPHESHLNFTLQFFIDFNLFGMSNIDLQAIKFRKTGISQNSDDPIEGSDSLKSESVCHYEGDCVASHIINRQRIGRGDGIENPGLEEVWNQEMERRKQLNMSLASKSLTQGRIKSQETETHYKFEQMYLLKASNLINKPADLNINKVVEEVYYPAESMEGSQFFKAVDVSIHLPDQSHNASLNQTLRPMNESLSEDLDETLVDESVALNSSLHYSQILLDSEDLELVGMLQDMEDTEKPEEDSIMATPGVEQDADVDSDDAEYSQVFNEDTILLEPFKSEIASNENTPSWHDSFWDGVNIPQLDGTFDDDHVKKVRKRKMRPFKLGLSRPKSKKQVPEKNSQTNKSSDISDIDEVDVSQETIDSISSVYIQRSVKNEVHSSLNNSFDLTSESEDTNEVIIKKENITDHVDRVTNKHESNDVKYPTTSGFISVKKKKGDIIKYDITNKVDLKLENITDLVEKVTTKHERSTRKTLGTRTNVKKEVRLLDDSTTSKTVKKEDVHGLDISNEHVSIGVAEMYDIKKRYEPVAGCSTVVKPADISQQSDNESFLSSPEDDFGIQSFYNKSRFFDMSVEEDKNFTSYIEDSQPKIEETESAITNTHLKTEMEVLDATEKSLNDSSSTTIVITPKIRPPTKNYILSSLESYKIPKVKNREPFFSDHKDSGDKVEIGLMVLKTHSKSAKDQKPFEKVLDVTSLDEWRQLLFLQTNEINEENSKPETLQTLLAGNKHYVLEPIRKPPTKKQVEKWVEDQQNHDKEEPQLEVKETTKILDDLENSQAIGLNEDEFNQSISLESNDKDKSSLNNSLQVTMHPDGSFLCFGGSENHVNSTSNDTPALEEDFLTIMLVEVHTSVRGDLNPDPLIDPIQVVFIKISNDCPPNHFLQKNLTEVICVDDSKELKLLDRCIFDQKITYVNTESDLLEKVIELVKSHDPDIITGYEIEMGSWGYLMERAQILGLEVVKEISRITEKNRQKRWRSEENDFEGRIIGRVMFNVWRLLRHELALSDYSFENCMYEILKERVPAYSAAQLATWWNNPSRILRWITVEHYLTRLSGTLRMMEKLDMINRTSELARLFGLQWWEVLSRGSQFRVESLMLRAARPLNLIALSPSVRQRAAMRAPEMLPLIFEPESRFYADPVIVLDFQSLYPSMMIAYNYCFSTCIGRVQNINGDSAYEFGAWRLRIPRAKLDALVKNGLVHWSPVGVGFVKPSVRRGVLPALLRRILAARQAVKKSMKQQTDEGVKKAMHSRQLGLKLIANVTYGYTAANFSGRMPCIEVGDSVVAKGRETLERAIKMVRDNKEWNAKVVYGDTDSMFVQVPGGTREEAFRIGQRIADAVTADNPSPVALKLEKVYQPCILQTKKRYVGYMSESPDQEHPVYEAKGIETVRRDGCPAQVKLLQKSLCELFSTGDLSRVKRLVTSALTRLVDGTMSPQELFFTREYHGVGGYKAAAAAPPNEIAKRLVSRDRRALPRTAWRVSWLVCAGAPGTPLVKLARTPNEVARDGAVPHVAYYAARVLLPPLHRCLSLLGLDVFKWWKDLGFYRPDIPTSRAPLAGSIARYMWRSACVACGVRGVRAVCGVCAQKKHTTVALLANRGAQARQRCLDCQQICESCCGHAQSVHCKNTTCAVLWARISAQSKLEELQDIILHLPEQFKTEIIEF